MLHRAVGGSGRFRIECVLRPAAMVVLRPSAWFWKNTGQNTNECMLARAARGLPFRTIRVKCLVDGLRFSRLPGCHTPKGVGSRTDARTRWQNDQHFSEITHSRQEWPPTTTIRSPRPATRGRLAASPATRAIIGHQATHVKRNARRHDARCRRAFPFNSPST